MPAPRRARKQLPYDLQVRVLRRDRWLCRWCHGPVIFAPALRFLREFARTRGHGGPLAYHDPRWRRDRAPLLDHLGAVVDHVQAFSHGGAHAEANLVTSCNKCNARKSNTDPEKHEQARRARAVKGKYGEPEHWDGFSTIFVLLAGNATDLSDSEKGWLAALTDEAPAPAQ